MSVQLVTSGPGHDMNAASPFRIDADATERWASLSGDRNPVHFQPHTTLGLDSQPVRIAHGMLVATAAHSRVEERSGFARLQQTEWRSVTTKFRSPTPLDRPCRIGVGGPERACWSADTLVDRKLAYTVHADDAPKRCILSGSMNAQRALKVDSGELWSPKKAATIDPNPIGALIADVAGTNHVPPFAVLEASLFFEAVTVLNAERVLCTNRSSSQAQGTLLQLSCQFEWNTLHASSTLRRYAGRGDLIALIRQDTDGLVEPKSASATGTVSVALSDGQHELAAIKISVVRRGFASDRLAQSKSVREAA